jgi:hypothetical protein
VDLELWLGEEDRAKSKDAMCIQDNKMLYLQHLEDSQGDGVETFL